MKGIPLLGLTIHREWAWLIAEGYKRVENRSWTTTYRGPLAIHAGLKTAPSARLVANTLGISIPDQVPGGVILAVAELVDVLPCDSLFAQTLRADPFAEGPFCFILDNIRKLREPRICRGLPGLFPVPADVMDAVETGSPNRRASSGRGGPT